MSTFLTQRNAGNGGDQNRITYRLLVSNQDSHWNRLHLSGLLQVDTVDVARLAPCDESDGKLWLKDGCLPVTFACILNT